MANPHEELEHAEHIEHAAHDPFGARVALSIAVIAAILAAVTLLSHQAHNTTLQKQIEAGVLQTRASDQWAFYQAKKIRQHEYKAYSDLVGIVSHESAKDIEAATKGKAWSEESERYKVECDDIEKKAKGFEEDAKKATEERPPGSCSRRALRSGRTRRRTGTRSLFDCGADQAARVLVFRHGSGGHRPDPRPVGADGDHRFSRGRSRGAPDGLSDSAILTGR